MSLERKEADLKKIQEAIKLLKSPGDQLGSIAEALAIFFELGAERMAEEIAEERGG